MKATILIYEGLNMVPRVYTLRGCKKLNIKRLWFAEYRINTSKKMEKNDKFVENEGKLYEAGGF